MNDDSSGIDLLRRALGEVAASLPAPPEPRRRRPGRGGWVVAAAMILALAGAWTIVRRGGSAHEVVPENSLVPSGGKALGIDVLMLKIHGQDVTPRVFDAKTAGTIVVAPAQQWGSRRAAAGKMVAAAGGGR